MLPVGGSAMRAAVSARNSAHGSSCGGGGGVRAGGRWSFDMLMAT